MRLNAKNMGGSCRQNKELKEPDTEGHMVNDSVFMKFRNRPLQSLIMEVSKELSLRRDYWLGGGTSEALKLLCV